MKWGKCNENSVMSVSLVVNASPLIFLGDVGGLSWLTRLGDSPVVVPRAVAVEVEAGSEGKSILTAVERDPGFSLLDDVPIPSLINVWNLGHGESQVIAHGFAQGGIMILDDRLARQCARSLGLGVIGTLGIILEAKHRGWIEAARPIIQQLMDRKMYLSSNLVQAALREAGE
jgi:predicted nucleic acid-binding protein